jgi:glucose dehydrogenase
MSLRAGLAAFLITCAAAACGTAETRPAFPANRRLIDADREPRSWLTHGRTYSEQRFSPLTTLTPDNVSGLGLAWSYELRTTRGAEATPLDRPGIGRFDRPAAATTCSSPSIVAVDATSGVYKWHYQTAPGDTWDYNATQPIVLADLTIDGAVRKVAMQAPKNGFFYVIDRRDGRLISAKPFVPMYPIAETPKGMALSWAYGVDQTTGRPLENPEARYLKALP